MTRKLEPYIVDTNVAVAADNRAGAGPECVRACIAALQEIMDGRQLLVVDEGGQIVSEYRNNLYSQNQPTIGTTFLRWIWTNQYNLSRCSRVAIKPRGSGATDYEEFPQHEGLKDFDPADRKFVAVSVAHPDRPVILEATDTKWWGWKSALSECGIRVKFLCKAEIAQRYTEKFEKR
jgi:hypothetical protein